MRYLNRLHSPLAARRVNRATSLTAGLACTVAGAVFLVAGTSAVAQITQGSGSSQQENRTSEMGSKPDPSASVVHESNKPQTKDGASGNARGQTAGKNHKPQGAGGFENGLYGTGTGSNK